MELTQALFLYIVVVIVLIVLLYRYGIRGWSAVIIALVIGQVLLILIYPPQDVNTETDSGSGYPLYVLIQFGTVFAVYIYAVISASKDRVRID